MVLQKDDENTVNCEQNETRSVVDDGRNTRANDGGGRQTVGLPGVCAQRERFGKELCACYGGGDKSKMTTEKEINKWKNELIGCGRMSEVLKLA